MNCMKYKSSPILRFEHSWAIKWSEMQDVHDHPALHLSHFYTEYTLVYYNVWCDGVLHQEQGSPVKQGKKEGQPVNPEEKQEAQRGVLEEEIHAL